MYQTRQLKTFFLWFLFASFLLGCGGGGGGGSSAPAVTTPTLLSISVSTSVVQVPVGLTAQFVATGLYSDGSQQNLSSQVVWSVSDPSKASINASTGLLTGLQAGTLSVNAAKEGIVGSFAFTISQATLNSLQVSPASLTLAKGTSQAVTVTAIFSDLSRQDVSEQVEWESSNSAVAFIAAGGSLVDTLEQGSATLTASLSGSDATLDVTVTNAELVAIALTPLNAAVPLGVAQQYVAQGTYTDGSVQDLSSQVTWESSNAGVAVISNNAASKGRVDTLAVGSTTISAVQGAVEQSTTLTVDNAQLSSIDVQPTNQTIAKGEDATIAAFGNYTDGVRINITSQVNWNTNSTDLIDLSLAASGILKTLEQGEALLSAELNGITSIANVRVSNATLDSITIEADSTALANGTSLNLIARGHYSDASSRNITTQVTWQSSDLSVLSVANSGADSGQISALGMGQSTISASLGAQSIDEVFTVTNAVLSSLLINGPSNNLNVNSSIQLSAEATYSDASTQDVTNQVNWLSKHTNIATVDNTQANKGRVSGLSVGDADIEISLNGVTSDPFVITVSQDANLPTALNLRAQPNIILNNDSDAAQISINVIPALPSGTIADGTALTLTITEGETARTENLSTTNGVASYNLTSDYQGVITLSASLDSLAANSGILSTNDFSQGIIRQGLVANIAFENDTLKKDSAFLVLARNISNRTFLIKRIRFRYLDPNNGDAVVDLQGSPVTDPNELSGGSLTAGEFTSTGYQLDEDIAASVFAIVYFFEDEETSTEFPMVQLFDFGQVP